MTWHQWHQTAPMSRRMGLSSALARAKAASFHSCQSIGWCAAERRYGLAESFRRFPGWSVKVARGLRLRRKAVESLRFAQDDKSPDTGLPGTTIAITRKRKSPGLSLCYWTVSPGAKSLGSSRLRPPDPSFLRW